jgi:hypothetical protein
MTNSITKFPRPEAPKTECELVVPSSSLAVAEQVDVDIERLIAACWGRDATGSTVALGHLRADIMRLLRYTVVETREMFGGGASET